MSIHHFSFIILFLFTISLSAQEKIYTKGLANGYAWTAPHLVTSPLYAKEESLLAALNQRKVISEIDSSINQQSFPLFCDNDVEKLLSMNTGVEMKDIALMIDDFYKYKENLIIPVLGAYCYSVKKLIGKSIEELGDYRQKLLEYSAKKSEK